MPSRARLAATGLAVAVAGLAAAALVTATITPAVVAAQTVTAAATFAAIIAGRVPVGAARRLAAVPVAGGVVAVLVDGPAGVVAVLGGLVAGLVMRGVAAVAGPADPLPAAVRAALSAVPGVHVAAGRSLAGLPFVVTDRAAVWAVGVADVDDPATLAARRDVAAFAARLTRARRVVAGEGIACGGLVVTTGAGTVGPLRLGDGIVAASPDRLARALRAAPDGAPAAARHHGRVTRRNSGAAPTPGSRRPAGR